MFMSNNFQVEFKKSNGNLHVHPSGVFDGSSAWELVNLLHEQYDGQGQVYIDTGNLKELCPFGCSTFQCRLNRQHLPFERLYFKGDKGAEMAPKGSNVLTAPHKHRCCGNCANCTCNRSKEKH
jgi:hypothetical protein